MIGQRLFRGGCVVAVLVLAACASQPPAPVVDLSSGRAASSSTVQTPPTSYVVQRGDTLYAISLLHDVDWRDLAQWNNIGAPYLLTPGMQLRLTAPPTSSKSASAASAAAAGTAPKVTTPPLEVTTVSEPEPASASASPAPATTKPPVAPSAPITPAHTPDVAAPPAAPAAPTPSPDTNAAPTRSVAGIAWRWPAKGKVVQGYRSGDPAAQGIDIVGQRGEPVRAAADGTVVYSGDGLVGYGELIIVKHDDTFLSAYGHNSKRLVHEGDRVHAGQQIAEMGSSGTSRVELHFEIRKQGKPVDPLAFLPAR